MGETLKRRLMLPRLVMHRGDMVIRGLIGAAIGVLGGAIAGALTFGWDASMAVGSSWIGPTRDWWPLAAYFGAFAGAVFGVSLGLYISLADVGMRRSAIAGGVVGVIEVIALLSNPSGGIEQLRSIPSQVGPMMLSLIIWVVIGLLLGAVATKLRKVSWR